MVLLFFRAFLLYITLIHNHTHIWWTRIKKRRRCTEGVNERVKRAYFHSSNLPTVSFPFFAASIYAIVCELLADIRFIVFCLVFAFCVPVSLSLSFALLCVLWLLSFSLTHFRYSLDSVKLRISCNVPKTTYSLAVSFSFTLISSHGLEMLIYSFSL